MKMGASGILGIIPIPPLDYRFYRLAYGGGASEHGRSHGRQGLDLLLGGARCAGDDGAGVAHAPSRRSRTFGDEGDHGFCNALSNETGSQMLSILLFGDYASFYLALLNGAAPTPAINSFKGRLAVR